MGEKLESNYGPMPDNVPERERIVERLGALRTELEALELQARYHPSTATHEVVQEKIRALREQIHAAEQKLTDIDLSN